MLTRLKRYAVRTEDWLRYNPLVRNAVSKARLLGDQAAYPRDDRALARSISKLCGAARLLTDETAVEHIQHRIHQRLRVLNPRLVNWKELVGHFDDGRLVKAAILKPWTGPREKGVLFISFENQWIKLLNCRNLDRLVERYTLVLAPSSSPHNLINYAFPRLFAAKIFTLISNPEDAGIIPRVASNYVVVPLLASHWVNPERFRPLPRDRRDIDLIMVASFSKVKRHYALFAALRAMPPHLRVVLMGQEQDGRNAATLLDEARCYGVADRVTIMANQDYAAVTRALERARASVVLSRREGSCVAVAESLFADTPVALLRGAEIGSRIFINRDTGRFLDEDNLGSQLTEFVATADEFQARDWAEKNISCFQSSSRLNGILKDHALQMGQDWTADIAPLTWCPDPRLARSEDHCRLQEERQEFKKRFGLTIGSEP